MKMKSYWKYILAGLQNEKSMEIERHDAFEALLDLYRDMQFADQYQNLREEGFCDETMQACFDHISSRSNTSDMSCADSVKLCNVMYYAIEGVDTTITVNKMLNQAEVFPWILNRFLSNDNEEHHEYARFLSLLLNWMGPSDRVSVIIRYYSSLRKVARDMLFREVECDSVIPDFFSKQEMLGLLASMAYTVYEWVQSWMPKDLDHNTNGFRKHWNSCYLIVEVMENAMESTILLEELLGYDMLRVARLLAFIPYARDQQARVFRTILTRYPKFNESFRKMTSDGDQGNPIANLGRTIPPKAPTIAGLYIFEEED